MTDHTFSATVARWQDGKLPPEERAIALLEAMTPFERLRQLGSTWPGQGEGDGDGEVAPMAETFSQAEPFEAAIAGGLGHLTRPFGTAPVSAQQGMARLAQLQSAVVAANRFGVPAIAHEECLTGFTAWSATVYPTALAWGATFDPDLIQEMAATIGRDMAAVGVHQGLAPVLDVVRDYRWGRVEETIGEDPVLVGAIGSAYVQGLQSAGVIATLKHFAGYSASRGARNHAPVSIGERELRDVVLPPFRRAIAAGARSVMNSYADLDGVPPAASHELLTKLLRDEWGFNGTVVSDYWSLPFLQSMHHVAEDLVDAGQQALAAGVDVELPHTLAYGDALLDPIVDESLNQTFIDRAALRVLTQKAELGLLDPGWQPKTPAAINLDSSHNRALAERIAERSIILLENRGGLLPLTVPPARIAVIGPVADDHGCLFGCYAFPNHVVPNFSGTSIGVEADTYLEALKREFAHSQIRYEIGVGISSDQTDGIAPAVEAVTEADLTFLFVGDRSGMFGHGTSGEGCDVSTLSLPGQQEMLVDAVLGTGKPVVLVVSSGRPYAIGGAASKAAAAIQCFLPGEAGGAALASIVSGRVAPSGRLPVQIPATGAPSPGTYLAAPLALKSDGVSNLDPTPAYPFGYGLSYTRFTYGRVNASEKTCDAHGRVHLGVIVRNTGSRAGTHIVQLYLSDPVASVVQPVRRLIGFRPVHLEAGASRLVEFDVPIEVSAFTDRQLRRRIEPGQLIFTIADSASDIGQTVHVQVTGPMRYIREGIHEVESVDGAV